MPLIHLDNIWKSYGAHDVLTGITWQIDPGERIGLVGHNGCGKTTLFRILTGTSLPDRGQMHRQRDIHIGYLAQEPVFRTGQTVFDAALEAFADLLTVQHKLHDMEHAMTAGKTDAAFLEEYGRLRDRYEHQGGYALEARTKAILFGLGFRETDLALPTDVLSGGQKNRLALAQLLARDPHLLLLDEPTNHLDLQALEWLEHFLSEYANAFVVISHDRYFLNRTAAKIVEIEQGQLHAYSGNYAFYVAEKALRKAQQQKAFDAQQAHIARTEEYIRRNIAGQKTKQAQSRRHALEKLERIDQPLERRDIRLHFTASGRGGDRVFEVESLGKTYGQRTLFKDLQFTIWRGDRLGIVGANGTGKSTLLKILAGQLLPDEGTAKMGKGLEIGYFDQTRQDLNPNLTILDEVWSVTPDTPIAEIRAFLGAFLFTGDDVERKIGTLSGGEQSRIALAKLMRIRLNLLMLDEPTNHLDIPSRDVLEEALETFEGTLIAISHDRYFLNRMVNRLLVLEKSQWHLIEGNYDAWQQQSQKEKIPESGKSEGSKSDYAERKRSDRERERRKRKAEEIEKTIAGLEAQVSGLDAEMASKNLATDWNRLEALAREKSQLQRRIEDLFSEWEQVETEVTP